jgi:hypothetical protein
MEKAGTYPTAFPHPLWEQDLPALRIDRGGVCKWYTRPSPGRTSRVCTSQMLKHPVKKKGKSQFITPIGGIEMENVTKTTSFEEEQSEGFLQNLAALELYSYNLEQPGTPCTKNLGDTSCYFHIDEIYQPREAAASLFTWHYPGHLVYSLTQKPATSMPNFFSPLIFI